MKAIRGLIDRLIAWNHKPRYRSAEEVSRLLHQMADGSAKHGSVDAFICIPIIDPRLENIRNELGAIYGPSFDPTHSKFVRLVEQVDSLARS